MGLYVVLAVLLVAIALVVLRLRAGAKSSRLTTGGTFPASWSGPLPSPTPGAPRIDVVPDAVGAVRQAMHENALPPEKAVVLVSIDPTAGYKLDIAVHGEFDPALYVRAAGSGRGLSVLAWRACAARLDGLAIEHTPAGFVFGGALRAVASQPGRVRLSKGKLATFLREMADEFGPPAGGTLQPAEMVEHYLMEGDSRAAVVITTEPTLLVASYTDELACVVPLRFPRSFVHQYVLERGSRLLTVNSYMPVTGLAPDLVPGQAAEDRYVNFSPIIADFLTDDAGRLRERKEEIREDGWQRTLALGTEYVRRNPGRARDARPGLSCIPS